MYDMKQTGIPKENIKMTRKLNFLVHEKHEQLRFSFQILTMCTNYFLTSLVLMKFRFNYRVQVP